MVALDHDLPSVEYLIGALALVAVAIQREAEGKYSTKWGSDVVSKPPDVEGHQLPPSVDQRIVLGMESDVLTTTQVPA
jgi:hypothetical protein